MFTRVTSYPPLGQITSNAGKDDTLHFTVIIESDSPSFKQSPEAQIWHNISGDWTALSVRKCDSSYAPLLSGQEEEYHRHVYSEELAKPAYGGHRKFTVRFRFNSDDDWQWANQFHSVTDGELVFSPRGAGDLNSLSEMPITETESTGFGKYIDNLSPDLTVQTRQSEAPGSVLWHLSGNVDATRGNHSAVTSLTLGTPSSMVRFFSLARVWTPWIVPRHGKKTFKLTEDAVLCSFFREDGTHLLLLAVSGINDVETLFKSGENGEVIINALNDNKETSKFQVLASAAQDFEVAISAVIYEARKLVAPYSQVLEVQSPTPKSPPGHDYVMVEKDPEVQWLSEWYDGLTYCTWNGLGQDLSEEKILKALGTLKKGGIKIANLIIDDNWQSLDNEGDFQFTRRWKDFEANPKTFPHGLKHTVDSIRRSYPNIEHIAVWHALFGYWGGISPQSNLLQKYKMKEVKIKHPRAGGPISHAFDRGSLLAVEPDDIQRFYDDFYGFLTSAGIDSVKADAQFFLDLLENPEDRRRFITAYQNAWSISSLKHFSTRSISCMSQIPQTIFHSQLPTNKPTIPIRNSDDFSPDYPTSHPWHIFCNAHNALFTRFLNALPDWDMFQTGHPYASFHAAARCVSGGPIYITDEPGKHDMTVLNQMTAPTTHGTTVILRPSVVGRSMDRYNEYNEGHILRVGTYNGYAIIGSGIMGLFNISTSNASCIIPLKDFSGIETDSNCQYIVRAHTSGKVAEPMAPSDKQSLVSIALKEREWEILTAYPVQSFTFHKKGGRVSDGKPTHVAVLGLLGKMTGVVGLANSSIAMAENGRLRFEVSLKALGTLGIYLSDLQDWSIDQNFMVMISGQAVPRETVWKEGGDKSKVLAVDVLKAWKAMGLDSGWSNELIVKVYVG